MRELNARRKDAQPTNRRTFGSVFKNPDHELTAGRMLEACGLKGFESAARGSLRSMQASSRTPAARSRGRIAATVTEARQRAKEQFGVRHGQLLRFIEPPTENVFVRTGIVGE